MVKTYLFLVGAVIFEVCGTMLLPVTQNFTKLTPTSILAAFYLAAFKTAIVVKRLPKTRSGKIQRGTDRKIADKEEYKMPATIDDPAILDEIKQDLIKNNILK